MKAGLARAKAQGKRLGRRPKVVNRLEVVQLRQAGLSLREIARKKGVSQTWIWRALRAQAQPR